jgi:Fe-S-cluster containining protein
MAEIKKSAFEKTPCTKTLCPEKADCCTTVRWRISEHDYHDPRFHEWWLLHEGARIYEEDGIFYIQWPMRCRNVSADGLRCMDYDNRPDTCRFYVCKHMTDRILTPEKAD